MPADAMLVVLLVLGGFIVVIYGAICGILSRSKIAHIQTEILTLRGQLEQLKFKAALEPVAPKSRASSLEEVPPMEVVSVVVAPPALPVAAKMPDAKERPKPAPSRPETSTYPAESSPLFGDIPLPKFDEAFLMKVVPWVGMFMCLIGTGFFLRYAYNNNWIGLQGRLAIGVLVGLFSLGLGEHFRRRQWPLFQQIFSGGGFAILYICDYVAFGVYHLITPVAAMALAILINAAAVLMAVAENTVSLAGLAVLGGFLSPILLSTGENNPHGLFIYVAILNLAALGAAYFRRWPSFDLLCFCGTLFLYAGWYNTYYDASQMAPALGYASLFYLMFLVIPVLHHLLQRTHMDSAGLALLIANAVLSFSLYYQILHVDYRYALGFVVLGQAALLLALFQVWAHRIGTDTRGGQVMLAIALALIIIAVPIRLQAYGIPLAWAAEGCLLIYLGVRFPEWSTAALISRISGLVALVLSVGGLFKQLPLHTQAFIPVLNMPFLSWVLVIGVIALVGWWLRKPGEPQAEGDAKTGEANWEAAWEELRPFIVAAVALSGVALSGLLASMEVWKFWDIRILELRTGSHVPDSAQMAAYMNYQFASLVILWAAISAALTAVLCSAKWRAQLPEAAAGAALACYVVTALVYLSGCEGYGYPEALLVFNWSFFSRIAVIAVLWWGSIRIRASYTSLEEVRYAAQGTEVAGHFLLVLLLAMEMHSWSQHTQVISRWLGEGIVSALWAAQACGLVWVGLVTQERLRRYAGLALFGTAILKVVVYDTSNLETVYRIISWLGTGVLLLAASYFYHQHTLEGAMKKENLPENTEVPQ